MFIPQNQHLDGENTQVHGYLFYPKFHQDKPQERVALGPLIVACEWVKNQSCILGCLNQRNNVFSKKHVVKILVEALTSYSTFFKFIHLFVAVFIISKVVALNKLRRPITLLLVNSSLIT